MTFKPYRAVIAFGHTARLAAGRSLSGLGGFCGLAAGEVADRAHEVDPAVERRRGRSAHDANGPADPLAVGEGQLQDQAKGLRAGIGSAAVRAPA
jgi:hypothetical protein